MSEEEVTLEQAELNAEQALEAQVAAEAERLAAEEEAGKRYAEKHGLVSKAEVEQLARQQAQQPQPNPQQQVDPFAQMREELAAAKSAFDYDKAMDLTHKLAVAESTYAMQQTIQPLIAENVVENVGRAVCKGLPPEALDYFKDTYGYLNPAQLQQMKSDPVWSKTCRDACAFNAQGKVDARVMSAQQVASRNANASGGLTAQEKAHFDKMRSQHAYRMLSDAELEDTVKEALRN